jgi:hypothetical protein
LKLLIVNNYIMIINIQKMADTTLDLDIERLAMNLNLPNNAGQICQYCAIQALNDLAIVPKHGKHCLVK